MDEGGWSQWLGIKFLKELLKEILITDTPGDVEDNCVWKNGTHFVSEVKHIL